MTELYSLERPERITDLSEALKICGDIIDSDETEESVRDAIAAGLTTKYTVVIAPAKFGCKTSIEVEQYRPPFEIKFMNGLNPDN
jgi:hypothetical protein